MTRPDGTKDDGKAADGGSDILLLWEEDEAMLDGPAAPTRRSWLGRLGPGKSGPKAKQSVDRDQSRKAGGPLPYVDAKRMLRIGKRHFGLGLLWTVQPESVSLREVAQLNAVEGRIPDLVVRRRKSPQVGFGFTLDGQAQGERVAATGFRFPSTDDWIAAFALDQTTEMNELVPVWWLVGNRAGLINEDRLFYERFAAQSAMETHLNSPGWSLVIAPEDWRMPSAVPTSLAEAFNARGALPLQSMNPVKAYGVQVLVVALLAGLGAGGYFYWQNLQEQERLVLEMGQRRIENERLAASQIPPWVGTPVVSDFLRICTTAIERNLMFIPGWTGGEIACALEEGAVTVSTSWDRTGGRAAWILAASKTKGIAITLDPLLGAASMSASLTVPSRGNETIEPLAPELLERILTLRFDTLLLDATLTAVSARAAPSSASEAGGPAWNYHTLTFRTSAVMDEYLSLISDIPAVVPERLSYSVLTDEWAFGIRIYHPPVSGSN